MVSQCTKFEVSRYTRYEAVNGGAKCRKWGCLGWLGAPKITGNATIRQGVYDFLFDFNRNYVPIFYRFYRAMLYIRGTSLCPSDTSRSSTKTAKHRITQTTSQPRESSFLTPKISAKCDRGHPLRGRQIQVGWVKIGDFRQISGYISKTVQDRRMVSIKVEQEVVCALSNGDCLRCVMSSFH